jgi:hypothetical protein
MKKTKEEIAIAFATLVILCLAFGVILGVAWLVVAPSKQGKMNSALIESCYNLGKIPVLDSWNGRIKDCKEMK